MKSQRLRNLTTGRLHTEMTHIYQDIEYLTGMKGVMTHMIPNVMRAMELWLKEKVADNRFWDDKYDVNHQGEFEIQAMTNEEQKLVLKRYADLPSPF